MFPISSTPFYVYNNAAAELLTQKLFAVKDPLGASFEPLILTLLRTGGSKDLVSQLEPFRIDPTDISFWDDALKNGIGPLLEEAEKLSSDLFSEAEDRPKTSM